MLFLIITFSLDFEFRVTCFQKKKKKKKKELLYSSSSCTMTARNLEVTKQKKENRLSRRLTVNTQEPYVSIRPIIKSKCWVQ
jgi:hypothetical protein